MYCLNNTGPRIPSERKKLLQILNQKNNEKKIAFQSTFFLVSLDFHSINSEVECDLLSLFLMLSFDEIFPE